MKRGSYIQDRDISRRMGTIRSLTPRQRQVLQEMSNGGTQEEAYLRLIRRDPSWTTPYELTFINFRQHLSNAYGRLQAHSLEEALRRLNEAER